MKRGAMIGAITGGVLGIIVGICIVWIGLVFDDSPDGIAPLIMFGLFSALMMTGFVATVGAVVGALAKAISKA